MTTTTTTSRSSSSSAFLHHHHHHHHHHHRDACIVVGASRRRRGGRAKRVKAPPRVVIAFCDEDDDDAPLGDKDDFEEEEEEEEEESNNKKTTTSRRRAVVAMTTMACIGATNMGGKDAMMMARAKGVAVVEGSTSCASGTVKGAVTLPSGYHLTRGARSRIQTTSSSENVTITNGEKDLSGNTIQFEVGFENANAGDDVTVNALVYFCQDDDVCLSRNISFRANIVGADASSSSSSVVNLAYSIPTPEPEMSFVVPQFE